MSSETRYDAMDNLLTQSNAHTIGVLKILKDYYPAFAKKIFEGNPLIEQLAMCGITSFDILKYPVCNHCEALAMYFDCAKNEDGTLKKREDGSLIGVCKCKKCGTVTEDPVILYDWCLMELRKRAPATVDYELIIATDALAEKLIRQANYRLEKRIKEKAV